MIIGHHLFLVLAAVAFLIDLVGPPMTIKLQTFGLLCLTCSFLF